jgi:hypothetical protein
MVATARSQGERPTDYFWCVEGELVWFGHMCRSGRENPDGGCGCGRGFAGLSSHRATTTVQVRDLEITYDELLLAMRASLEEQGWELDRADEDAHGISTIAAQYPEGTVLERRLFQIRNRWWVKV